MPTIDIEKIRHPMFGAAILGALLIFAPGLSYLFQFERWVVIDLDIFKILSLAIALIAPFVVFNTIFLAVFVTNSENKNSDRNKGRSTEPSVVFLAIFISLFLSAAILYLGFGVAYLLNKDLSFAIRVDVLLQLLLLVIYILGIISIYRKNTLVPSLHQSTKQ
jgi:hypothetical protein